MKESIKTDKKTNIQYYDCSIDCISSTEPMLKNTYFVSVKLIEDLENMTGLPINPCALLNELFNNFISLTPESYLKQIKTLKIKVRRKFYNLEYKVVCLENGMTFISINE